MNGRIDGPFEFRKWLSSTSVLLPGRTYQDPENWFSSTDTLRIAKVLFERMRGKVLAAEEEDKGQGPYDKLHGEVVSWTTGQKIPDASQARILEEIGGPPSDVWGVDWISGKVAEACNACASHRVSIRASDYETYSLEARRYTVQSVIATAPTIYFCEDRRRAAGPRETRDITIAILDMPDSVPFDEWDAEAWCRIASAEGDATAASALAPLSLRKYLSKTGKSADTIAAEVGVTAGTVSNWIAGRTAPSIEHAFALQTLGAPCYLNWIPSGRIHGHRKPAIVNWSALILNLDLHFLSEYSIPSGTYRPSRGMFLFRTWFASCKKTLPKFCQLLEITRNHALSWMGGTATPSLENAWRLYWDHGGPPVKTWLVDHSLVCDDIVKSVAELAKAAQLKALNAGADELEKYKEEARWAVGRPVAPPGPKPQGEDLARMWGVYTARIKAADDLMKNRPGALEGWKRIWAPETVDGKWVAPWNS